MKPPVNRVNVDFTLDMLKELDAVAMELNISRQAVIKAYLRQALDQHYLARAKLKDNNQSVSALPSSWQTFTSKLPTLCYAFNPMSFAFWKGMHRSIP
jgi:hypothetical protein